MKGLKGVRAYVRGVGIVETDIGFEDGKITHLGKSVQESIEDILTVPSEALVLPGFVDEHIHGAGGSDAMDATPAALETISTTVAKEGTTAFLATTMTQSRENIAAALENVRICMEKGLGGARTVGVHLEGPYIEMDFRGAQNAEYVAMPTVESMEEYRKVSGDNIRIVTFSPHESDAVDFVHYLKENGITAAVGHSGVLYDRLEEAADAGLRSVTHTYNAQSGVHHRKFGVAGAALLDDRLYAELICDTIHVCPPAMKLLVKCKPRNRLVLVTDAIRAKGLPEGESELGGQKVFVKNGEARLADGTLAGSVLHMNHAVRNLIEKVGVSFADAVDAASYNPACNIGLDGEIGSIAVGKRADFTVVNAEFEVLATVVGGKVVYQK